MKRIINGKTTSTDIDDAESAAWRQWASVFSQWMAGNPEPMAAWLLDPGTELDSDAREFLADLVHGKVKRPRGRRTMRQAGEERAIVSEVFTEHERQADKPLVLNPRERAIAVVAKRRKVSTGTVRGIVEKLAVSGITLEAWQRWGRPVWAT